MDFDDNIKEARDKTYKHYKSEVAASNWLLFLSTVLPYHGIALLIFWRMGWLFFNETWGGPYLIFISAHIIFGMLFTLIVDALTLYSLGARNERFFMQEEKFLIELYAEALNSTKEAHPHLYKTLSPTDNTPKTGKTPLYIVDDIDINAYATGFGIILTKGAINGLSHDEIKGFMAHELGHFNFPIFMNFLKGFMFVGAFAVAIYKYIKKYTGVEVTFKKDGTETTIKSNSYVSVFLDFVFLVPSYYFKFVSSLCFRTNEFRADYIAVLAGYGEGLKNGLRMIYNFELMRKYSLMDRLIATHPPTAKRIVEIERLLDTEHY